MLTPEQAREKLQDRVVKVVAAGSGLHENTVSKLKCGTMKSPSFETMEKISAYFEAQEAND